MHKDLSRRAALAAAPALCLAGLSWRQATAAGQGAPLLYFSDYYSFVGRDEQGFVYLAHDNNRGRDGDAYQADHWIAMYDEATGWIDVKGSAHYPNTARLLERIPASEHFVFTGTPETGVAMTGATNDMILRVSPLPKTLYRENEDGIFWVGGAPATLEWKGRKLMGRVLFEYLQRHNWNRFTGNFETNWKNFNGLYLMTDKGADFYAHYHEREGGTDLNGKLVGLASWGEPAPVSDLDFKIAGTAPSSSGRFAWPTAWDVGFTHNGRAWRLMLETKEKREIADWTTGGFMMSVVKGAIAAQAGGERLGVVGWGELLI
jgi:hypothetical protein